MGAMMQDDLKAGREAQLAGDPWSAVQIFEAAVASHPADPEARYWLASARLTAGDPDGAARAMDEARILQTMPLASAMGVDVRRCRSDPAYAADIATHLYARDFVAMSAVVRTLALSAGSPDSYSLLNYGLALQHQGRVEEACHVFSLTAETFPSPQAHQFLLLPTILADDGYARYTAEAKAWIRRYGPPTPAPVLANPPRNGRKLRIGYVAPTFARSQLRQFMAPLLEAHDPEAVEVTLYPAKAETEVGWPDWIKVRPIGGLDDADAAALIRRDGIDVLADCWGHTAGSRLLVFARRAAPVQLAWINFVLTTGLSQMDYVTQATSDELAASDGLFTERTWPIGPVFTVFRPAEGRLAPTPTPALSAGRITFGSFNHPAKLNDWVLDAWAGVLRNAPESRLLLKYRYFGDPVMQRATQARFVARGVAPERIVFEGHTSGESYFAAFGQVDLMLDAWPAPGSTTTLEALSNGVPVLAMADSCVGGVYARSILEASGLPELVTATPEAFVDRALELTEDLELLNALRARVRPAFEASACCDGPAFTRRVEQAFGQMFDLWRGDRDAQQGAA